MAQFVNMFEVDLDKRSYPVSLNQTVSEGNVSSNRIGAYVYKNGAAYNLGGNCTGMVMRADGSTVPLTGVIDGNAAYVILDQPSCAIPGPIQVAVNWVSGSNTTTLLVAYGTVIQTNTRDYVQPGTPLPDINELLAAIEDMEEATAAAEAAATKAVRYDTTQTLTDANKATGRGNINAASISDADDLKSALNRVMGSVYRGIDDTTFVTTGTYKNNDDIFQNISFEKDTTYVFVITNNYAGNNKGYLYQYVNDVQNNAFSINKDSHYTVIKYTPTSNVVCDFSIGWDTANVSGTVVIFEDVMSDIYDAIIEDGGIWNE